VIDCHFHIWTTDNSTEEARAQRATQIRREAKRLGVDRICLIGPYALGEDFDNVYDVEVARPRRTNEIVSAYVEEYPDSFYGWAQVDPREGDKAVTDFRRAVTDGGLIGLKHHFYGSPVKCSDHRFDPLAEAAVDMGAPILEHVLHRLDPYPEHYPDESYTEDVVELARRFPDLKLIAAHIAGGGDWEYRIKNIADQENVYLDVSGSIRDAGIIEMAADRLGVDRLVFGTDTWFVPGVGKLEGCTLTADEKAEIAYKMEELLPDDTPNSYTDEELEARREQARERFESDDISTEERTVCTNGFVGNYAHRAHDASAGTLIDMMDEKSIDVTMVSSAESTMYRNSHAGNELLHEAVDDHRDRLVPIATINPTYPAWKEDLETCLTDFGMDGVKLLPAYHDYDIDIPEVRELLDRCAEYDVPVVFTAVLEDQRQRHPRVRLREFDGFGRSKWWSDRQVDDLIAVLRDCPETDVIIADAWEHAERIADELLTVRRRGVRLNNQVRAGETLFVLGDLNMYFTALGEDIVENVGVEHLVFGPKLPFKIPEAYSNYIEHLPVDEADKDRVRHGNIEQVFDLTTADQ
jgi:predicted TIM-barrel fold metal-dependent hydrolase